MGDAWNLEENSSNQKESPYIHIANQIPQDDLDGFFEDVGQNFRVRDQFGNKKVLGAAFPDTFADHIESIAESPKFPFGHKSNFVRTSVYLLSGVCSRRDEGKEIQSVRQHLDWETQEVRKRSINDMLKKINQYENDLFDLRYPEFQWGAEQGLKGIVEATPYETVRKAAQRVIDKFNNR